MSVDELDQFRADLKAEEARVRDHVRSIGVDPRTLLVGVVRAYDAAQFYYSVAPDRYPPEFIMLLNFGINGTLAQLVPTVRGQRGIPFFAMDDNLRDFALALISQHGRIALAQRLLDLASSNLMRADVRKDSIHFERSKCVEVGVEALDVLEHARLATVLEQSGFVPEAEDDSTISRLRMELRAQVRTWKEHFIAYKPTAFIDDYFERSAMRSVMVSRDFGSIHPKADFADFTGAELIAVLISLKALHLKHSAFCMEYLRKFPGRRADNVLTIWTVKNELVTSISDRTGLTRSKVRKCLSMMSLGPRNASHHLERLTTSIPSLVEAGEDIWIRPLSSGIDVGSDFVCLELRRSRPSSWSKNTNLREGRFRTDLYGLFADEKYVKLDDSKVLKRDKRILTDVDATIFDREAGTLALFQLKWQEVFGWDERERRSRAQNFVRECEDWLTAVDAFIAGRTAADVAEQLGVHGRLARKCRRIRRFIIGRFAARFSGLDLGSACVATSTWTQFTTARAEQVRSKLLGEDPLDQLYENLRRRRSLELKFRPLEFEVAGKHIIANELFFEAPQRFDESNP